MYGHFYTRSGFVTPVVSVPGMKINTICIHWQAEDAERREKNLEEAKKIAIENDPNLPEPKTVKFKHVL